MAFRYLCLPPTQSLKPFFSLEYSQTQQATNFLFPVNPSWKEQNNKNTKKQKKAYPYFVSLYTNTRFSLSLLKEAEIPQCEPKDSQVGSLSKFLLFKVSTKKKRLRRYSTFSPAKSPKKEERNYCSLKPHYLISNGCSSSHSFLPVSTESMWD